MHKKKAIRSFKVKRMAFICYTYSNLTASPSNDSSATLIESVGQPSNASIMSSNKTSGISAFLDYRQG